MAKKVTMLFGFAAGGEAVATPRRTKSFRFLGYAPGWALAQSIRKRSDGGTAPEDDPMVSAGHSHRRTASGEAEANVAITFETELRTLKTDNRGGASASPFYLAIAGFVLASLCGSLFEVNAQQRNPARRVAAVTPVSSLTITTEPNAIVWIDEIRRGQTDAAGKLEIKKVSPAGHTLRVRATGFKETSTRLLPGKRSVSLKLLPTSDQAELLFQQAEAAREQAKDDPSRRKAEDFYNEALKIRPSFPAAHVGLARILLDLNEYQKGLGEIDAARRGRPVYAEASAVEGRLNREAAFIEAAINSFRRSIREAKGFQPEAHVGLARVFEDRGQYAEAVVEYRKALDQLSDSEPVIYQLLGAAYEKQQNYKDAVAAYETYLQLAPNGSLAPAIRSIIDQLRRDAAGQEIIP
ncbi:MAG: tetratricopeptide repeat protein [bacterium]